MLQHFVKYVLFTLSFANLIIFAQSNSALKWQLTGTGVNSNLSKIILFSSTSGVISGRDILLLENGKWELLKKQPPAIISLMDAQNKNSIFISSNTEYQESEMYYWNGMEWEKFYHPLVNNIYGMHFENKYNGIIYGLGEIAILKNSNWNFISPPTNNVITDVYAQHDTIWALTIFDGLFKYTSGWQKIINSDKIHLVKLYGKKIFVFGPDYFGFVKSDSIHRIATDPQLQKIRSIDFIESNKFFAVGQNGIILKYSDSHFEKMDNPVNANLNSIMMINENEGWIVGDDGVILHLSGIKNENKSTNKWQGFVPETFYSFSKVVDDGYGVVAEDFDSDGKTDLFICGLYENNHLYINKGDFHFNDEGDKRGISSKLKDKSVRELNLGACAGDFDNDGEIDLYVSSLTTQNKLYHNLGYGYFVDYTNIANAGGENTDRTNAVITGDVNNDGSLDTFICNENTTNRLFLNNGAGIFTEVTEAVNLTSNFGGTGASFSDIDLDGDLDLYVANWSCKNELYKNLYKETGQLSFADFTDSANVGGNVFSKSNGVVFADIDNDADADLFVTNRKTSNKLYLNNGKGFYKDVTNDFIGKDSLKSYGAVIKDFDGDGFKDLYVANVGENKFYINQNGKKFIDQTNLFNADVKGYSTGLAASDLDNDRHIDLYVANYIGSSSIILRNKPDSNKTVSLKLIGVADNTSAIGSKIFVYKTGHLNEDSNLIFYTEVNGGSGYGSMNDLMQIIPCLDNDQIDIKIIFPSGKTIVRSHLLAGSSITISDLDGYNRRFELLGKFITRLFFDPHRLFEFLKWIFVFILLGISTFIGIKKYSWSFKIILASILFVFVTYYYFQWFLEFENIFFSSVLPLASIIIFLGIVHLEYERKKLKSETEIEKENLREKLSRDLHDDLASTLSSVTIYLELLKQALTSNSNNIWTFFNKANSLLVNAKQTITDLIWTIKPAPEKVTDFTTKIRENFIHLFKEKRIRFAVNEINLDETKLLPSIQKHNIYLIIKECVNNIFKYAEATDVKIEIEQRRNTLKFSIVDNGKGFDKNAIGDKGNGLNNMKKRSEEIEAAFSVESILGKGTKIIIILK